MSLSDHLADSRSPIRRWFDTHARVADTRQIVATINTEELAPYAVLRSQPDSDPALVGTAFDYGVRWMARHLMPRAAMLGAGRLHPVWPDAEACVTTVIAAGAPGASPDRRARCCVVLAWFEQAYRTAGFPAPLGRWIGQPLDAHAVRDGVPLLVHALLASVPAADAVDVATLLATVPTVWGDEVEAAWIMNPTFTGSPLVGGADADWISGSTLWECKTSSQKRPFSRATLLQTLAYALLDRDNAYELDTLGWYYARYQARFTRDLRGLCGHLFGTFDVRQVRERFWSEALGHLADRRAG